MEKINIAEILKDCPQGTKLYSPMCGECTLHSVDDSQYAITVRAEDDPRHQFIFTVEGKYLDVVDAECVLFPSKDQRDWGKFQRPYKDGDILTTNFGGIFILDDSKSTGVCYGCVVGIGCDKTFRMSEDFAYKENCRLATEEEKQKLFDAIKDNGYKWNEETKTLEKLIEPKFKVGDRVVKKNGISIPILITGVGDELYYSNTANSVGVFRITEQDDWELVPNKFDINTLKAFDKVLVRDTKEQVWVADLFSHPVNRPLGEYTFACIGHYPNQCIPFVGNEHLLGTTDDCDEYYKTWEK